MVALALASACGGSSGTSASGSDTDASSSSTGTSNNSFPTTGDMTAGSESNSGSTTDTPTSGNSESNSNSGVTDTSTSTSSVSASESGSDSSGATATETTDPNTSTTTGDTTGGESTMGVSDSDSASTGGTTGGGESTTGADDTTTGTDDTTTTGGDADCDPVLDVMMRDFKVEHPDFEKYGGNVAYKGLVKEDLGPDKKPVYAAAGPTPQTSGPEAFKQWYNDTPNINQAIPIQLTLTEIMPGIFQYKSDAFFPLDNQGFGNQGFGHNFAFTTEIHTQFIYNGGESFTFTGDDDMWMFINNKLAIDLGGLHPPDTQTINLDAEAAKLGITKGLVYSMDIFHAERHSTGSNFRIDTTIGCFIPQ
ncbi:MAG TPA: fibro-slime domain-containing protein [Nannocystis sp.]